MKLKTPLNILPFPCREDFWYWASMEQLRLLLLVLIVVFGRTWTPFVQLHVFIFVLLLSVGVSLWLRPLKFAAKLEVRTCYAVLPRSADCGAHVPFCTLSCSLRRVLGASAICICNSTNVWHAVPALSRPCVSHLSSCPPAC